MKTTINILLTFFLSGILAAQSIEKFSIDSGGASATAGGLEIRYTIGEVNIQELAVGSLEVSEGFINSNFKVRIDPKLFLQGPMLNPTTAGLMNDDLHVGNYLPTTSPYADNATVTSTVFNTTGNNAIVDWVWLEIRQANDNTKIVRSQSALLQRDGDIVDLDGVSQLTINAAPTNYFVVVNHRNHLGAMSAATVGLKENTATLVDFKNSGFATFGSNAQVQLPAGDMALWAGDTANSGQIVFSGSGSSLAIIRDYVLADPANIFNAVTFAATGYLNSDVNLDGTGKFSGAGSETSIIRDNVLVHAGNIFNSVTYKILETVPPSN